jgi:DNA polymerase-1
VPGVRGIGEKTAVMLLDRYYTLEKLLADCENIPEKSVREKICNGVECAKLSQYLATIVKDVDVNFDFEKTHIELPDSAQVMDFLKKMQFYSFLKQIDAIMTSFNKDETLSLWEREKNSASGRADSFSGEGQLGLFAQMHEQKPDYDTVTDIALFEKQKLIAFKAADDTATLAFQQDGATKMINVPIAAAKAILENENIKKTTHDVKTQYNLLRKLGISLRGVTFDTVLASYIKDPARNHAADVQAIEILGTFVNNAADEVAAILKLTEHWKNNLDEKELRLLYEVELPLSQVLADMEHIGVSIDTAYLKELTESMNKSLSALETKIYDLAGGAFNINSPKQVGETLFEKLGIKHRKRGGKYSTSAEVLEELAPEHEIADLILQYRKFAKLKSTYTEALPALINPVDHRIHTSYNQTVTTTGRLSSSNPNLQNIPIRTEEGSKIRQAFVPADRGGKCIGKPDEGNEQCGGGLILSADYSQIELRLLAHVSGDKHLMEAFTTGVDVHTLTASKVFDVPVEKVTKEMRYKAKAVNFGIIYGQGKYGLAKAIGISYEEAGSFIHKYFETYPNVKAYMDNTIHQVEETGYVETIFGRKRYLGGELSNSNAMVREFAKRAAINQPMQGTAADLMKMAMIDFWNKLNANKLKSKMIMQVHDEIVVEADKSELETVTKLIKESMELGQPLSVPLVVDVSAGASWRE